MVGFGVSTLYGFASFTIAFKIASMQPKLNSILNWNIRKVIKNGIKYKEH